MAHEAPGNLAERFADAVLRHILGDAAVTAIESQSHGEHDFDLDFRDGRRGCVEVASVVDSSSVATMAAITAPRRGGQFIPTVQARDGWYVTPKPAANIGRLREGLDAALARLDAAGITSFDDRFLDAPAGPAQLGLQELGVESCDVVAFVGPGKIMLGLPSTGGWVNPGAVNEAVAEAAARPDNIRKLSRSGYDERHLFVFVGDSAHEPHAVLFLSKEVSGPAVLPEPVTHAWIGTFLASLSDVVVWRTSRGTAWSREAIRLDAAVELPSP